MALHPDFPADPYAPLLPDQRWFPAAEELRASAYEKLLPPLVAKIREEVKSWRDDFQITLHIQDDVRVVRETGNLFLTNIHRVFLGDVPEVSLEDDDLRDYFLSPFGPKPVGKTTDSKTDLGEIVREIEELAVFNDEAHHIHDSRLAWFKSIQDIHHRMLQKDCRLALQVDVTATPRHNSGAIFVQTVSVLMLKEGWDVKNVTTIVGLRVYAAESKILPEQTLGRGLRRMYFGSDIPETVSVMGTPAYGFVYVDQEGFEKSKPNDFAALVASFTEYQETAR
ncbi:MAG: DEAD/DEAH box helicase family protein [Rhodocyclaceae bacterium]|nr:DEAD/DEAH box helicase family protein [Rhodocyclaceae bacterium]